MTKTMIVCDFCGKMVTPEERIYLKHKPQGRDRHECNFDMCSSCWDRIQSEAKKYEMKVVEK